MRTIQFDYDECSVMLDAIHASMLMCDAMIKEASKQGQYGMKNMFIDKKKLLESAIIKIAFSEDEK